jgi:F-type H+-transporting ATPase subunit b
MRFDWSTLALQLANFAILVWLLQRFLYRPILRLVDARRAALEREHAEATGAAETAKRQLSELQAQRAGLAGERAEALVRAQEESRQLVTTRREEAERDAAALMEEARRTLTREREQVLEEARRAALDLAADIARRVLAEIPESLRVQAWLERVDRHLGSLPPAERAALSGELAAGSPLRVLTAWPLAAEAEEGWRLRLRTALGSDVSVVFETDPALIAGAELRFPHAKLSFSVAGAIAALQEEVGRRGPDH